MINQSDLKFIKLNKNLYKILNKECEIQIQLKNIKIPFGLEKEYNKYKLKLDINDNNNISEIYFLENLVKNIFQINDDKIKSVIRKRAKYNDLLVCNLKMNKDNIFVTITYLNTKDYLKSIYDIDKDMIGDYIVCVDSVWHYPDSNKSIGLNIYIKDIKIH